MVTVVTASDLVNVNQLNFIASQEDEAKVLRLCLQLRLEGMTMMIVVKITGPVSLQVWCEELFSLSSNLLSHNLNRDQSLLKA